MGKSTEASIDDRKTERWGVQRCRTSSQADVSLYPGKGLLVKKVRLLSALAAQDVALPVFSSFLFFLPPKGAVIIVGTFAIARVLTHFRPIRRTLEPIFKDIRTLALPGLLIRVKTNQTERIL